MLEQGGSRSLAHPEHLECIPDAAATASERSRQLLKHVSHRVDETSACSKVLPPLTSKLGPSDPVSFVRDEELDGRYDRRWARYPHPNAARQPCDTGQQFLMMQFVALAESAHVAELKSERRQLLI